MTVSAGMVFDVRQSGNDANGGGFRGGCELSAPSAPSVSATSGGSVTIATYKVVITITTGNGETSLSAEASVTTSSGNQTITVISPTNPNILGSSWNVYIGTVAGGPYFLASSGSGLAFGSNYTANLTPPTTGTNPPGTDYSQQNSPQLIINNSTITCTTPAANSNVLTFTSGYTPTSADVGNIVNITAGTNINTGWYEITGWTSTTWNLSRIDASGNLTTATAGGSAITGNMGGAFASPGMVGKVTEGIAGSVFSAAYIKYSATPYTCSATQNVSGGKISSSNGMGQWIGYDTTRTKLNTDANRPSLDAGAASMTIFSGNGALRNIIFTNSAARASVIGYHSSGGGARIDRCKASGCMNGFEIGIKASDCLADSCTSSGFNITGSSVIERCVSTNHTGSSTSGFNILGGSPTTLIDCVAAYGVSGAWGFYVGGTDGVYCVNCVSYKNAGAGFGGSSGNGFCNLVNCIAWGNGTNYQTIGNNASFSRPASLSRLQNCAGGGATTLEITYQPTSGGIFGFQNENYTTLTANPFTNGDAGDFSLNSTAGGGTACKGVGLPGHATLTQLPGLSTLSYPDLGAVQHQPPGGVGTLIFTRKTNR